MRRAGRAQGAFSGRGGWRLALALVLLGAVALQRLPWTAGAPDQAGKITGLGDVRDGDSINIGRHRIRLEGIDAPELEQSCMREGRAWPCGREALRHLERLIGNHAVACVADKSDQHQRLLGTCVAAGRDLNRSMILDGMAVAYGRRYAQEEAQAKRDAVGLWAGEFERPQHWRRTHMRR